MHELPVIESILEIVLRNASENDVKKVNVVNIVIGELCHLEDVLIQRYFQYLSKDTVAEGAMLVCERSPVMISCKRCGQEYQIDIEQMKESFNCSRCESTQGKIISGQEFYIKNMEVD